MKKKVTRRRFFRILGTGGLGLLGLSVFNTGCQWQNSKETFVDNNDYINVDKERIKDIVKVLSSKEYGGRRAGTQGEAEAGLCIAQRLQELHLEPLGDRDTYFQSFPLPNVELRQVGERAEFSNVSNGQSQLVGDNILGGLISHQNPDQFIMLSGHYDHLGIWNRSLYPGANDNCSGISALLEIARNLKGHANLPYSIIFAFWSAEEMGLIGSNYFINHPTVNREKIKLNINLDSIGTGGANDFLLWTAGPKAIIDRLVGHLNSWEDVNFEIQENPSNSSDHRPLGNAQIPAITILAKNWLYNNHTPLDTHITLNYNKIQALAEGIIDYLDSEDIKTLFID